MSAGAPARTWHATRSSKGSNRSRKDVTHITQNVTPLGTVASQVRVTREEWEQDPKAPAKPGNEVRENACPTMWYMALDSALNPKWDECVKTGIITACPMFDQREKCWERWDAEFYDKAMERAGYLPVEQ